MKVNILGANKTEIELGNRNAVLFSYDTPVVYYNSNQAVYFRTTTKHSRTTSKHINSYIPSEAVVKEATQEVINKLVERII